MENITVRIEGISPLLMHKFPMTDEDAKSKARDQKKNQDNVESYLYLNDKGKLAKYQIVGQGKMTYKNLMGSGAVIIDPDMILHEKQDWEIDRRPVVIQRARIVRERPMLKEWALEFTIEYDEDEIHKGTLKEIMDYAGRRVGIGDFRPSNGGPFGRFIVTKFD